MGRAKGVVLLPPSPLTCIIPCMLLFSPLPSLLVTQGDPWGKESNTVAVFIETFLIPGGGGGPTDLQSHWPNFFIAPIDYFLSRGSR